MQQEFTFSQSQPKAVTTSAFQQAYNQLNQRQKQAVDQIEGPVMVNAGPGTGKTQILATRIGKILLEQQIAPHNILCLTYTDAATVAMRSRLIKIIGPTAHQIHIYTFHGFCNQVINENIDVFGGYKRLEALTELEEVDVYRSIIENLADDNPLKRFKQDKFLEIPRMKNLFALMKKENIKPDSFLEIIASHLEDLKTDPDFLYKRKYTNKKTGQVFQKGDLKPADYEKAVKKFNNLSAAVREFDTYNSSLLEIGRYDFADMILWVLTKFKEDQDLLLKYQERYQYFLIDEYQDTNGAQNEIINLLINYWDSPNVFVVGDDDQAIYKFQGANIGNIQEFQTTYSPTTIFLEENYRSSQEILNSSAGLIDNNKERIKVGPENTTKQLVASGKYKSNSQKTLIQAYDKTSDEVSSIAEQLEAQYLSAPESLGDTAIIYRKHRQVDELVTVLEKRGVPYNIKKKVNILELPIIKNIRNLLGYLAAELKQFGSGQNRLFEILHYSYFGNHAVDVGKLAMHMQRKDADGNYPDWRSMLADEEKLATLNLINAGSIHRTTSLLDSWIQSIPQSTIQVLFQKLLNEGRILQHLMADEERSWNLQVISTFFDFIKNETAKKPDLQLIDLLQMWDKMDENRISLKISKKITSEKGVRFMTAHGAKGMEFKKVYIIGCNKSIWDNSRSNGTSYSYPPGINGDADNNQEDERRLFYVAMTRAKTDLLISYAIQNEDGKDLNACTFVDELMEKDGHLSHQEVTEDTTLQFYYNLLRKEAQVVPLIDRDYIDNWLEGYRLSVTHLNKYLTCPVSFYFESILRIPQARTASSGFGSAIHDALHQFISHIKEEKGDELSQLLFYFGESMHYHKSHFTDVQYKDYMTHGKMVLTQLHTEKISHWTAVEKYALEEELSNAQFNGVPLKGFLDKVEISGNDVDVIDYKTGKYRREKLEAASEKNPLGGDYWRQIVFYKLLLLSDRKHNWNMTAGVIDFVEPDKYNKFRTEKIFVQDQDIEIVGQQIEETMANIKAYKFDETCDNEKCTWCNFVKDKYTFATGEELELAQ